MTQRVNLPYNWKLFLGVLSLTTIIVWFAVLSFPKKYLKLIACDVGQGDAIVAMHGNIQVLVDGGPNDEILDCLSSFMPFWDRDIELVILTHPQTDHFKGLIEVIKRYNVKNLVTNTLDISSNEYQVLKKAVGGSDTTVHHLSTQSTIRLGLMHLDIVWPTEEFIIKNSTVKIEDRSQKDATILGARTSTRDPNDFSIIAILRLGEFDALLTGDIGPDVMNEILETGLIQDVEYIKTPHHGSKNGLTKELLISSSPEVAVISVGEGNRYGHPHQEVLDLLKNQNVKILRTDEIGDVVVESDGNNWWIKTAK